MPCYVTGTAEGDARLDAEEVRKELTKTTRLLCKAMALIEPRVTEKVIPSDLKRWWAKHKKIDKARK